MISPRAWPRVFAYVVHIVVLRLAIMEFISSPEQTLYIFFLEYFGYGLV